MLLTPDRWVRLEVLGRRTGRVISFPLVIADYQGERYLVAMLGQNANWLRNVRAAGGRAVLQALRQLRPGRTVVAVPAAPASTCRELAAEVDEVVSATTPSPFYAVGAAYWDFTETTDDDVRELLRAAQSIIPAVTAAPSGEAQVIRAEALPVIEGAPSTEALFDIVGDAHYVLIGESVARHARDLPGTRLDHAPPDRGEGLPSGRGGG